MRSKYLCCTDALSSSDMVSDDVATNVAFPRLVDVCCSNAARGQLPALTSRTSHLSPGDVHRHRPLSRAQCVSPKSCSS